MAIKFGKRGFGAMLRTAIKTGPLSSFVPQTDFAQILGLPALFGIGGSIPPGGGDALFLIDGQSLLFTELGGESLFSSFIDGDVNFNKALDGDAPLRSTRIDGNVKRG